jgi:hypothetical protein
MKVTNSQLGLYIYRKNKPQEVDNVSNARYGSQQMGSVRDR